MTRWSVLVGLLILGALLVWAGLSATPLPEGVVATRLVLHKQARTLELYQGGALLKTYHVSLGRHPLGAKAAEGDGRTPEGRYTIDAKNLASGFHKALHVSYPSPSDAASAATRGVRPGGLVMLHGMKNRFGWIGRAHRWLDWTNGCVAVTDDEIDEIVRVVPVGTPIEMQP